MYGDEHHMIYFM